MNPRAAILVVEDAPESQALMEHILSGAGYQVRLADSGELALLAAEAQPPDLVLLDLHLPGLNGFEVCRRLKAKPETGRVPVILVSGQIEAQDWTEGRLAGAADYVVKPVRPEELLTRVATHLALAQAQNLDEEASALRRMNAQLESEVVRRQQVETELQASLAAAERARQTLLSAIEDRQQAEAALRESETRLRLSVAAANVGLWDWDLQTNQVFYSPEWKGQIGCGDAEISNRFEEWQNRMHPDDLEPTVQKVRAFLASPQGRHEVEFRFRHKNGSYRWIVAHADVLRDANDRPVRMLGCHIDITERKQAESALRESEELFRTDFEAAPVGRCLVGLDGRFQRANAAMCALLGYDEKELQRLTVGDATHPDDRAASLHGIAQLRTGAIRQLDLEKRYVTRDGRIVWGSVRAAVVRGADGGPRFFTVSVQDITARRLAEAALHRSERQLAETNQIMSGVLDHTPIMVVLLDRRFDFVWVNRAYAETCRQPQEFFPGKNHFALYPHAENEAIFRRVVDTGEPFFVTAKPFEFPDQPERGVTYWDWSLIPIRGGGGAVERLVFTLAEVTGRIRAEQALQESDAWNKAILGVIPDLIFVHDRHGLTVDVRAPNPAELIAPVSQLIGRPMRDLVPAELAEQCAQAIARTLATGELQTFEYQLEIPGLGPQDYEVRMVPLSPDQTLSVIRNVTETKRAGEALTRSEALYHGLVETSQDLIWRCDAAGHYTYLNPAWEGVFGYRVDEMLGRPFTDFQDPVQAARDRDEFAHLLQHGSVKGYETVHRAKDGRDRHLVFNAQYVRDDRGRVVGTHGTAYDITARKEAEAALGESEERFASAFEHAAIGMALVSPEGRWLRVNRAVCELVGYTESELLARTFQDITHPDDLETDVGFVRQMLAGEIGTYQMEKRYFHKAGHVVWVLLSVSLVHDARGRPRYFISQIQDITERKRALEELRESEERFRQLVERSNEVFYRQEFRTGRFEYVSPKIAELLGYTPDELRAMDLEAQREAIHPDDRAGLERFGDDLLAANAQGQAFIEREFRLRHRNGAYRWIHGSYSLVRDAADAPWLVVGALRDITVRRQAEEAVRASEERFRAIFEQAGVGVAEIDSTSGRFLTMNQRYCEITAYTREEMLALAFTDITHPDDVGADLANMQRLLRGDIATFIMEKRYCRKDGGIIWVNLTVSPLWPAKDPDARRTHLVIVEDITERKRAEEQIQAALAEKEVLLREVHHRVKNNLQVVSGLLELQAERLPEAALQQALRESQKRVRSIALVHETLYQAESLARLDLRRYVEHLVAQLLQAHAGPGRRVRFDLQMGDVALSLGPAVSCGLLINEVTVNALKHAFPPHHPLAEPTFALVWVDAGPHWRLTLSDNGVGLPAGLDWERTGTLGLRLVRLLVQQLKGTLRVEDGPGCRFVIEFPKP